MPVSKIDRLLVFFKVSVSFWHIAADLLIGNVLPKLFESHEGDFLMSPFAAQSFRTSALAIALALATAAINAAPAQAQTFNFIQKLQLNPLPFEDPGMNAYWKGVGKYSNSQDVWRVTITMNTQDKHPNVPVPGVITIDKWDFKAVNMRTGECHQVDLAGTVSLLDNSARLSGVTGGVIVNLSGIVRSWWTVKGARKGPNVIQGVLSFG